MVVLISGSGSNLQSIIDKSHDFEPGIDICTVISNNPGAYGLQRARQAGIATMVINHRDYPDRSSYDAALMAEIDRHQPMLVVLAGFMRILTTEFVTHYAGRLINIHPSLLPLYPGLNTHQRAIDNGDKEAGATVHFVTPEVDDGPIIIQARVPVYGTDSRQQLAARVLVQEHLIYPRAIQWFTQGRLSVRNGKVFLDGNESSKQQILFDEI
ncbi:MAG TPA: phosphoribosylglycinamide formyltransferase [Gammaproteobacteria bacterium]|nr:phosphoribosylglycinamide formyltransferase [Gammaproteobacteria bacterium]HDH17087.1 phosphoribosylglycinamide formyltransferase [Gammaproteobacteria bacterium]